jgi:hypothetical protein
MPPYDPREGHPKKSAWSEADKAAEYTRRPDGKVEVSPLPKPAWSNRSFLSNEAAEWRAEQPKPAK